MTEWNHVDHYIHHRYAPSLKRQIGYVIEIVYAGMESCI